MRFIRVSVLQGILIFMVAAANAQAPDLTMEYKAEIAARLIQLLNDEYVLPDKAAIATKEIQRRLDNGDYDEITDLQTFANRLTGTLDIIDDWHLGVNYYPEPIPEDYDYWEPSPEEIAERTAFLQRRNFGFERVERLPGNIALLEVRDFSYVASHSEQALSAAMQFIQYTDGLIIDLRRNGGGQGEAVQLLISYLIEDRALIGTTSYRKNNVTTELWTLDEISGPRYKDDKPVFVLVSNGTFSAAEAFTYALQTLARITVFGEVTIGGAHPSDNMRLDKHLMVRMPVAQSIDPRTGSNWQYAGIQPDHEVAADEAFDLAYRGMLEDLLGRGGNGVAEKEAVLRGLQN